MTKYDPPCAPQYDVKIGQVSRYLLVNIYLPTYLLMKFN